MINKLKINTMVWKDISYGSLTTFSKKINGLNRIVGIEYKPSQNQKYVVGIVNVSGFLNPVRVGSKQVLLRTNNLKEAQLKVKNYVRNN